MIDIRSIKMGFPSGKVKMILWENTEDEEAFEVKALDTKKPYILAYGIKYELTNEEISFVKTLKEIYKF